MALETIKHDVLERSNSFYRHYYHQVLLLVIIILIFILGAVGFLLYQFAHRPLPSFIAVGQNNQKMVLHPYRKPNLLPGTIIRWASRAAALAYTYDFVNYGDQVNAVRPYFTDLGWVDYNNSAMKVIRDIVQKQIIINGVVSGPGVIANEGPLPDKGYVWRVQIPFLVTYQAGQAVSKKPYYVIVTVVEVPTDVNPQGIGIDQFVMR